MNKNTLKLWICLSLIGLLSVASLLCSNLVQVFNLHKVLPPDISQNILPFLMLINPSIMVVIASLLGCLVYEKIGFRVPVFESLLKIKPMPSYGYKSLIVWGVVGGVSGGLFIALINYLLLPTLPTDYVQSTNNEGLHLVSRLFYGGVVEEIMMRFGLMSISVWILFKISKSLKPWVYWVANVLTALVFALGHFPLLFSMIPDPNLSLYAYILLGNGVVGIIYGYLYTKRGLETAMIAHMCTHLVLYSFLMVNVY